MKENPPGVKFLGTISKLRKRYEIWSLLVYVLHKTRNWAFSRRSRAKTGKEMYKKLWCTCKVAVLLNKTYSFFDVLVAASVVGSWSPYYLRLTKVELTIECFHSRGQHLFKFIGTNENVCIRKEFNSHRTGLGHQHGRRCIIFGHQYGCRDVLWKHSI